MLLYYNKSGQLLEYSDYGQYPCVGTNNFQIFAYFEDVDWTQYESALIRLKRPDLAGSEYPDLFMTGAFFNYSPEIGHSNYFKAENNPYRGFVFDFSKIMDGENSVILLDTPGMWEASITLINSQDSIYNVVGKIRFFVAPSVSWVDDEMTELNYSIIINNIAQLLNNVIFKYDTQYIRAHPNFVDAATEGTLSKYVYVIGSKVFDVATKTVYSITAVSDNPEDEDKVFATYEAIKIYGTDIEISESNNNKLIVDGKINPLLIDANALVTIGMLGGAEQNILGPKAFLGGFKIGTPTGNRFASFSALFLVGTDKTNTIYLSPYTGSLRLNPAGTNSISTSSTIADIFANNESEFIWIHNTKVYQVCIGRITVAGPTGGITGGYKVKINDLSGNDCYYYETPTPAYPNPDATLTLADIMVSENLHKYIYEDDIEAYTQNEVLEILNSGVLPSEED